MSENARWAISDARYGADAVRWLEVHRMPEKTVYRRAEPIEYSGIVLRFDGRDVTDEVTFSVAPGTAWRSGDEELEVIAYYEDEFGYRYSAPFVLAGKRSVWPIAAVSLAVAALAGAAWVFVQQPEGDTGTYIIPQGEMSSEEAQEVVDEQADRSRITVSLRPTQELTEDGKLHVNFVVVPDNNGYSERLEVEQDERIVYRSGVVEPEHVVEWGSAEGAHAGPAVATVYAVDADGRDSGNPVSVEVEIVDALPS